MESSAKGEASAFNFVKYIQSTVILQHIEKITTVFNEELAESQRALCEIQNIYNSMSNQKEVPNDNVVQNVDVLEFLEASPPNFLLPDMVEDSLEGINIEDIIAKLEHYAEHLKYNISSFTQTDISHSQKNETDLNLQQCSASLDQFVKELGGKKLADSEMSSKSPDLEAKLSQLCEDVKMFTKLFDAKTTLGECNKNWVDSYESETLCYSDIIGSLLKTINEVTYLLKNKN